MLKNLFTVLTDPKVASLTPTPNRVVSEILDLLSLKSTSTPSCEKRIIVEFGPGDGAFTSELLKRLGKNDRIYAFETNLQFAQGLSRILPDSRLSVFHADATEASILLPREILNHVDLIISGIPFTLLPFEKRSAILKMAELLLKPGGRLVKYQALGRARLLKELQGTFVTRTIHTSLLSFPPLYTIEAMKPSLQATPLKAA